ncbi:hypothetical protein MLD38_014399 [Melastoma candidum]|uniref:Uncharacterized protein n=1 Tax=Melastoma candidum TaxID=119954 RepID=A0ACB9REJ1_9MYRT|nr:hypothetical protein MLD38_014399 [Melastoma candidum]
MEVTNRHIEVKTHVEAMPSESDFELKPLPAQPDEEQLQFTTLRGQQRDRSRQGVKCNSRSWVVVFRLAGMSWLELEVCIRLTSNSIPAGVSGLTAYSRLLEVCKLSRGRRCSSPRHPGRSVTWSDSTCSYSVVTSSDVLEPRRCAGTEKKVDLLKQKLGFDHVFNYREEPDHKSTLLSVQGHTVRAALNMLDVIYKRIKIQRFLAADDVNIYRLHLNQRRASPVEDISGLLCGDNIGKKIVEIGQE